PVAREANHAGAGGAQRLEEPAAGDAFHVWSVLEQVLPSPLVGEGQGGGDGRTSASGVPPTPIPSPSCRRHASGMGGGENIGGANSSTMIPQVVPGAAGMCGGKGWRTWGGGKAIDRHRLTGAG